MLFITKAALMLLGKIKTFCGLVLKYANCTTEGRFLSIFVQFCGVTSVAKQLCLQLKPKNVMSQ